MIAMGRSGDQRANLPMADSQETDTGRPKVARVPDCDGGGTFWKGDKHTVCIPTICSRLRQRVAPAREFCFYSHDVHSTDPSGIHFNGPFSNTECPTPKKPLHCGIHLQPA